MTSLIGRIVARGRNMPVRAGGADRVRENAVLYTGPVEMLGETVILAQSTTEGCRNVLAAW